jgi:hypothetical protein
MLLNYNFTGLVSLLWFISLTENGAKKILLIETRTMN